MKGWQEYKKIYDAISKEMRVEPWVYIAIKPSQYTSQCGEDREVLHSYDLPRKVYERWKWVIDWRVAKHKCQFPCKHITAYYSYYNKKLGRGVEINELQSRIISAKGQITRQKNEINRYVTYEKANNLFFDEKEDEQLLKIGVKLQSKEENLKTLQLAMSKMLEKLKEEIG